MRLLRLEKVKWSDFFLQKRHFIYKLSVKKQETGQKTGKNPTKKMLLSALALEFRKWGVPFAEFRKWGAPFAEFRKRCAPFAE